MFHNYPKINDSPILIIGLSRSGTTLLTRIINAHPKIKILFVYTGFLRRMNGHFQPFNEKNIARLLNYQKKMYDAYGETILNEEKIKQIKNFLGYKNITYKKIYMTLMKFLMNLTKDEMWGEKYDGSGKEMDLFLKMFPKGKIILITRNLYDAFASYKMAAKKGNVFGDPNRFRYDNLDYLLLLEDWKRQTNYWKEIVAKYDEKCYYHVTYENLIIEPEKTTKKICDFLNIEWSKDMINPNKFIDSEGKLWNSNSSFNRNEMKDIEKSNIGKHRKELSEEELLLVEFYERTYTLNNFSDSSGSEIFDEIKLEKIKPLQEKLDLLKKEWGKRRF